jgi:OmpA-OmpF porin, OOP family
MRHALRLVVLALVIAALGGVTSPAHAQFGKLKDKLKNKAEQKVDKKVDQKIDNLGQPGDQKPGDDAEAPAEGDPAAPAQATPGTATAEDMTLYTKFDFVPGDKVIFYDDLSREEMGEFPSRWDLDHGVFEVAKFTGQNWTLCSDEGAISPKVPAGPLPDKYTMELEFYVSGNHDGWFYVHWFNAGGTKIGVLAVGYGEMTYLDMMGDRKASKNIAKLTPGKHVLRVMATRSTLKCYVDQERIANVPKVGEFVPVRFAVAVDPYYEDNQRAMIGAFRYAEGGKSLQEQLDEDGRIVTHGILFDSGSDRIKAESFKTLADLGGLLTENPDLRVSIEGHTDSDGAPEANQALAEKRAASVRTYLMDNFKVDGSRLESKGWGESKPLDANDTPEGKANNRRVELVKL